LIFLHFMKYEVEEVLKYKGKKLHRPLPQRLQIPSQILADTQSNEDVFCAVSI